MSIEEYLRQKIRNIEDGLNTSRYVEGKRDAFKEVLELLENNHELTLREMKDFCSGKSCYECTFCEKTEGRRSLCTLEDYCPADWDIEEIARRIK